MNPLILQFDVSDKGEVAVKRFDGALANLGNRLADTSSKFGNFESKFNQVGQELGKLRSTIFNLPSLLIGAAGVEFLRRTVTESIALFSAAEAKGAQLEAVLKSTGEVAGFTKTQLIGMAEALQEVTTFDDDAIISAQALLLTFTNIRGNLPAATQAVLDFATAMSTDASSAAIQLGKALQDPERGVLALTRSGVSFNQTQKDLIKNLVEQGKLFEAQKIVLAELAKEFGGSAARAADTLGGKLKQQRNELDNLKEGIGEALIPIVVRLGEEFLIVARKTEAWVKANASVIQGNALTFFDGFAKSVQFLARNFELLGGIAATVVGFKLLNGFVNLGIAIKGAAVASGGLATGLAALGINPFVLAAAGVAALFVGIQKARRESIEFDAAFQNAMKNIQIALSVAEGAVKMLGFTIKFMFLTASDIVKSYGQDIKSVFSEAIGWAIDRIVQLDGFLKRISNNRIRIVDNPNSFIKPEIAEPGKSIGEIMEKRSIEAGEAIKQVIRENKFTIEAIDKLFEEKLATRAGEDAKSRLDVISEKAKDDLKDGLNGFKSTAEEAGGESAVAYANAFVNALKEKVSNASLQVELFRRSVELQEIRTGVSGQTLANTQREFALVRDKLQLEEQSLQAELKSKSTLEDQLPVLDAIREKKNEITLASKDEEIALAKVVQLERDRSKAVAEANRGKDLGAAQNATILKNRELDLAVARRQITEGQANRERLRLTQQELDVELRINEARRNAVELSDAPGRINAEKEIEAVQARQNELLVEQKILEIEIAKQRREAAFQLARDLSGFASDLATFVGRFNSSLANQVKGVLDTFNLLVGTMEKIQRISELMDATSAASKTVGAAGSTGVLAPAIGTVGSPVAGPASPAPAAAAGSVDGFFTRLGAKFQEGFSSLASKASGLFDTVTGSLGKGFESLLAGGKSALSGLGGLVQSGLSGLTNSIGSALGALPGLASSLLGGLSSVFSSLLGGIGGGAGGLASSLITLFGFESGGVVPGPVASPRLVLAHGQEKILPPGQLEALLNGAAAAGAAAAGGGGGITVENNNFLDKRVFNQFARSREGRQVIVNVIRETQAGMA